VPVDDDPEVSPDASEVTAATSTPGPATATGSTEPSATATATSGRPDDFGEWPSAILRELNDSQVAGCPEQLMEEWGQTAPTPRCIEEDLNGDGQGDLVLMLKRPVFRSGAEQSGQVVGLLDGEDGYILAYDAEANAGVDAPYLFQSADLDGDDQADFVYLTTECATSICTSTVNVVGFEQQRLAPLPGSVTAANLLTAEVGDFVRTRPGMELELTSEVIASVEAGPQGSGRRLIGVVDGSVQDLSSSGDQSPYLYHRIRAADAQFDSGDYAGAIAAYAAALADTTLKDWHAEIGQASDRQELTPYALFRAGVAQAALGLPEEQASMEAAYAAGGVFGAAAGAFHSAYASTGDTAQACAAALEWLPPESVNAALSYGFMNPAPAPAEMCPF
jgi:hypothetical protein